MHLDVDGDFSIFMFHTQSVGFLLQEAHSHHKKTIHIKTRFFNKGDPMTPDAM